jgi:large subunit ribosomal protein L37Ae
MAKKSMYGSIRRFGSRYGRKTKFKVGHIESLTKSSAKCPYCRKIGVKKIAIGIFYCNKCKTKFTGKAYAPVKARRMEQLQENEDELIPIEASEKKESASAKIATEASETDQAGGSVDEEETKKDEE